MKNINKKRIKRFIIVLKYKKSDIIKKKKIASRNINATFRINLIELFELMKNSIKRDNFRIIIRNFDVFIKVNIQNAKPRFNLIKFFKN